MFDDGDDDGDSQDINAMHDSVTSPTITGIRGVFSIRDVIFLPPGAPIGLLGLVSSIHCVIP